MHEELLVLALDDFISRIDDDYVSLFEKPRVLPASVDGPHAVSSDDFPQAFAALRQKALSATCDATRARAESLMLACEQSFIAACNQGRIRIQPQALAWMDAYDRQCHRLAIGSRLSYSMVFALMEGVFGKDWCGRVSFVVSADTLSAKETEEEQYDVILRATAIPANRALLVTSSETREGNARRIGMRTVLLN